MGAEGRMSARGACRAADVDRLVLGEGGRGPRDVVVFVLGGAWLEVKDGSPEKRANNRLLERGNDAGVDGGVHEPIFDGIEVVGEDIVVSRDAHVACYRGWRLIHLSGW